MEKETEATSARSLIKTCGTGAQREAMAMANKMAARGDHAGSETWRRIAQTIRNIEESDETDD
jgi:hypothetical protein